MRARDAFDRIITLCAVQVLAQNMKKKAATLGANGILLKGFGSEMGGPGLVSSAFVAKPTSQSVAICVPRDSANIGNRCAAADSASAVR